MIHLMSYDFHGAWEPRLGHNAPLYESLVDVTSLQRQLNVKASVNYWLSQGITKEIRTKFSLMNRCEYFRSSERKINSRYSTLWTYVYFTRSKSQ